MSKPTPNFPWQVHFREGPNELQWDEEYATKEEADRRAYEIYINGGIAVVVPSVTIKIRNPQPSHPIDPENPDA